MSRLLSRVVLASVLLAGCNRQHDLGYKTSDGLPPPSSPDGGADAGAGVGALTSLAIRARHLVFDPKGGRLFATVGGAAASHANSLVVIDAAAGRVVDAVLVGSEPSSLAISDDGTTLWVGLDGPGAVRKVDLTQPRPAPGTIFPLPQDPSTMRVAGPMWVLQESATTLAVSMKATKVNPDLAGVVILDDGVARPMMSPDHQGAAALVRGPSGWLFGYDNLSSGFGFFSLPVTPSGVDQLAFEGLISRFDAEIVYAAGRVYATTGPVVDVTVPTAPVRAGAFELMGAIAPVPAKRRAYMISAGPSLDSLLANPTALLRILDTDAFTQVSALELPGLTEAFVSDLVQTSDTQLAFIAGHDTADEVSRIVLMRVEPL